MINKNTYFPLIVRYLNLLLLFFCVVFGSYAQEDPPRPMQVSTYQHLSFGAFINSSNGGTVTIGADGSRSVNGGIIPVFQGMQFHPAIFEVEANPGVLIAILPIPDEELKYDNSFTLTLTNLTTLPLSPFVNSMVRPARTQITVGGTLLIGSPLACPPGEYTGTFSVTFIQQ